MRMGIVIALHIANIAQMGAVPELMDSCFLVLDGTRLLRIFPSASPCATIHLLSQFGSAVMYRKPGSLNRSPISLFQDTQGAQFATSSYTPITCAVCIQHNSRKSPKKGCKIPYKWAQLFRKILLDKTGKVWYTYSASICAHTKSELTKSLTVLCVRKHFKRPRRKAGLLSYAKSFITIA